jgi:glycosyltransferase involved in cell wall biosynthesis
MKPLEVSVLICAKNSESTLIGCLESVKHNFPGQIIVIDGNSSDNTAEIARRYTKNVDSDQGLGLGYARDLGVSKAIYPYIAIISPDDTIPQDFLSIALDLIKKRPNLAGIQALKIVWEPKNFWAKGQNSLYNIQAKNTKRKVIGNPSIYRTAILKHFGYDSGFSANEDTDICHRISQAGYSFEVSKDLICYEAEIYDFKKTFSRYKWYGEGDITFIRKWLKKDTKVAIRHILHVPINYLIKNNIHALKNIDFNGFFFITSVSFFRLFGQISKVLKNKTL